MFTTWYLKVLIWATREDFVYEENIFLSMKT